MAEASRKLEMKFKDSDGATVTHSLSKAANTIEESDVIALMDAYIANTDIFTKTLVSKLSASVIVTDKTDVDITGE